MSISAALSSMIKIRPDLTEIVISEQAATELASEMAPLGQIPVVSPFELLEQMKSGNAKFMGRRIHVADASEDEA